MAMPVVVEKKLRPPLLLIGFLVFLQILVVGAAGLAMHYIVNKPDLAGMFSDETFLMSDEDKKIKELKDRIALLEQENSALAAKKTPKTIVKTQPDYSLYQKNIFKFYTVDGQVFVGTVVEILPDKLIIFNTATKKKFSIPKKSVVNVLTLPPGQ